MCDFLCSPSLYLDLHLRRTISISSNHFQFLIQAIDPNTDPCACVRPVVTMDEVNKKLFDAASVGDYEEVSACISRGASPWWTDGEGYSALHEAAWKGHVPVARLLLDHGWQLDLADDEGWTPLHYAADMGQVSMLQFLAVREAKINTQTSVQRKTPLHFAAENGQKAVVGLLLGLGADRSLKNSSGKTAEECCEDEETRAVFEEIPDKQPEELLARAVMEEDWPTAACLYSRGVPLDTHLDECKKQKVRKLAISLDFD